MTGQLRDYETVATDRLNQCQHQATKIRDLETKLAIASADLDAAGKQAQALQQQAVQAMDVRHTMEQMKDVMNQQHSAQQKIVEVRIDYTAAKPCGMVPAEHSECCSNTQHLCRMLHDMDWRRSLSLGREVFL